MSREDFSVTEGDRLDGAGRRIVIIESIDGSPGGGGTIVDVDFVRGGSVEEVVMDGDAANGEFMSKLNGVNAKMRG